MHPVREERLNGTSRFQSCLRHEIPTWPPIPAT